MTICRVCNKPNSDHGWPVPEGCMCPQCDWGKKPKTVCQQFVGWPRREFVEEGICYVCEHDRACHQQARPEAK